MPYPVPVDLYITTSDAYLDIRAMMFEKKHANDSKF
jgi:hypothetical protein